MSKRPKGSLNREVILEAALDLVDHKGLNALSVRRIGAALGVEGMALYYHFRNKEAILDGLVERVMAEVDLARDEKDWMIALLRIHLSLREALKKHPNLLPVVAFQPLNTPTALGFTEAVLNTLISAGFDPLTALHGYRTLKAYVTGYGAIESAGFVGDSRWVATPRRVNVGGLAPESFPRIVELLPYADIDHEQEFRVGLDTFLQGLCDALQRQTQATE